jgi:hypothetical protein
MATRLRRVDVVLPTFVLLGVVCTLRSALVQCFKALVASRSLTSMLMVKVMVMGVAVETTEIWLRPRLSRTRRIVAVVAIVVVQAATTHSSSIVRLHDIADRRRRHRDKHSGENGEELHCR